MECTTTVGKCGKEGKSMKKRSNIQIMARLIKLVRPLTGYMFLAILMGILGHLSATFITVSGTFALTKLMGFKTAFSIKWIFALMVIMAIARGFLRYGEQACNHYIAFKLLALIRDKVFKALRRLCPAKLEVRDKGNLISLITSDIELLEVFYAHTISPICIAIVYSVIMVVFIWHYNFILGVIALLSYLAIGVVIPVILSKAGGSESKRFRDATGNMSSFVLDSLRGLGEIIQYNAGNKRIEEMDRRSEELSFHEYNMKVRSGKNIAITRTVVLIFDVIMILVSSKLYLSGVISYEGLLISSVALMSSFGPVIALANLGSTLENTFAAGNRVIDILDEEPVTSDVTGKDVIRYEGASMENVGFSYDQKPVLNDINMEFTKGDIIGISGKSGSGKSTILKLLMRFWQADSGVVRISGKSVNEVNTDNLRDIESYVTQDTHLFKDTVYGNLRIAKPDATDEEIHRACEKASIHQFIQSLPEGYNTEIGELGSTLSGGEKQRLAVARAFLHNGDLMLMDEPTSNLDSLNEAIILNSLNQERGSRTIILVSHRESTMRVADKVYNMKEDRAL